MNNVSWLKLYALTLALLAVIDIPWILFVAKDFYVSQIGHLMTDSPHYWPAIIFYSLYAFALVYFVVEPSMGYSIGSIFLRGCFFGLIVYGAYDLTNQATLKNWAIVMTIVDMMWGSFLSGLVSMLAAWLVKFI